MTMSEREREFHRITAAGCFDKVWDCLEKKDRDTDGEQQILHLVHVSRFSLELGWNSENFAVADWQVSRVYVALGQTYLALQFAKSTLEICVKTDLSGILCTAYEGMARLYAIAKDYQSARSYLNKARSV